LARFEVILRRLAEIQPSAAGSPDLQAKIQELKREEAITALWTRRKKSRRAETWQGLYASSLKLSALIPRSDGCGVAILA